jgi:hypothetical protein
VGTCFLSSYREKAQQLMWPIADPDRALQVLRRKPEILDALRFIHSTAWPFMFGKSADDLQQAAAVRLTLWGARLGRPGCERGQSLSELFIL